MDSYDLIVVGGGIGGGALSAVMARAGYSVLVLERSEVFEDMVRGEWMAPWGVVEARRLGLLDLLHAAGGHHLDRHVSYAEGLPAEIAEAASVPLNVFAEGVPGPLCIGHPRHCQTLIDEAARNGATVHRGVDVLEVVAGAEPAVAYTLGGRRKDTRGRLVVGADGRGSVVREALGLALHTDAPHHFIGGMLVADVEGWDDGRQTIGVEGDLNFFTFPQGGGTVRIYGCFSLEDRARYMGADGPAHFLNAFRTASCPANTRIAEARQAGPLRCYANNDGWTETPFAQGGVLIGDAAGWNDPIIGQGLSITYRDVRIVSELLRGSADWGPALFAPYKEERDERMRRLRVNAMLTAELDAEFGEVQRVRRLNLLQRAASDPSLLSHIAAAMAGPDAMPAEVFTDAYRQRVLG